MRRHVRASELEVHMMVSGDGFEFAKATCHRMPSMPTLRLLSLPVCCSE